MFIIFGLKFIIKQYFDIDNSYTSTLIILHITKISSNNCLIVAQTIHEEHKITDRPTYFTITNLIIKIGALKRTCIYCDF